MLLDGSHMFSLAVMAAALSGGAAATYTYDQRATLVWRLLVGFCTGLAVFGLIGFLLAMGFGLQPWVPLVAGLAAASPAALILRQEYRRRVRADLEVGLRRLASGFRRPSGIGVLATAAYSGGFVILWRVAERAMFLRPDGIYTGVSHNIGDLPFHLSITNRFVYGDNFPPEHPSYAGVSFTYPFLVDLIGAMFVRTGMSFRDVIVWSTLCLCAVTGALFYRWTLELTGSRGAAYLAPPLAFLNGGVGWWRLVAEAGGHTSGLGSLLARLPHDYTITSDNAFRWGNLVTTLLVTQRGLLLGLPLALIVFHGWWQALHVEDAPGGRQKWMIAAGATAGLLPLVHAHSYAVVLGLAGCLALAGGRRRTWMLFFAVSLAIGLPQLWWVAQSSAVRGQTFLAWSIGWDHGRQNVLLFWLKNTGVFIPLVVLALCWRGREPLVSRRLLLFYLPFTLCFLVPNVLRLAPWIWDNVKVLVYWFIGSVPLVALLVARLIAGDRWRRPLGVFLLAMLTLAGALDVWRVASGAFEARLFDRPAMQFADFIDRETSPDALILHAPIHNHPVALTGRRSLMGYPGHVWSHGLDYRPREADIRKMYAGSQDAPALLAHYGVEYVALGPPERVLLAPDEAFFEQYERIGEVGGYRLYRTGSKGKSRRAHAAGAARR